MTSAVEVEGPLAECASGIHACRVAHLPYWLDDELWEIELNDEIIERSLKLVARRGRLLSRVEAWNGENQRDFSMWCLHRAALHAAEELRDADLDDVGLVATGALDDVGAAARRAVKVARAAGARNAERLAEYVLDAVDWTSTVPPSGVAYVAAHVADSRSRSESADAFAAERALQASWLADRLGLTDDLR